MSRKFKQHANWFRFYGPKAGRMVDAFSEWEWRQLHLLEADPNVRTYCEQFPKIDVRVFGEQLMYVFDCWVQYQDGAEEMLEVKPVEDLVTSQTTGEKAPRRWDLIGEWARQNQYAIRFVTDEDLLKNELLFENWIEIMPYVRRALKRKNPALAARVLGEISTGPLTIGELLRGLSDTSDQDVLDQLFTLLHQNKIWINVAEESLSMNSRIRLIHDYPQAA